VSEGEALSFAVDGSGSVSALLVVPAAATAAFVFAHGAGAGMRHPFMATVADRLAGHGIATLRYQFPSMERGSHRPDVPRVAHATVRAAVAEAQARLPRLPLFAGGKSFGGRMTSQAQADSPLPGVRGLAFVGFPLHPAGSPASARGDHLDRVACPMLFIQGTRDELADATLVRALVDRLGARATLATIEDADHAFHVRRQSGTDDGAVIERIAATMRDWMTRFVAGDGAVR
jgi:predicted alpha/beta-hydrolase family hydrolase